MRARFACLLTLGCFAALPAMFGLRTAAAGEVTLPIAPIGGGGNSTWGDITNTGADGTQFSVTEARLLPSQTDNVDDAATLRVGGVAYVSPGTVDLTGSTVTSGPVIMSGLDVWVQYYIDQATPTLRALFTFLNPTGSSINTTASFQTNSGSDSLMQVITTSSGDTSFTAADRWIIIDDNPTTGDAAVTTIVRGPGSPRLSPSAASLTVFNASGTQGVRSDYDLSIPAGQTQSLLFFHRLDATAAGAQTAVTLFDSNDLVQAAGLLVGLTQAQLAQIMNWDFQFEQPGEIPEPGAGALLVMGIGLGVLMIRRRPRSRPA